MSTGAVQNVPMVDQKNPMIENLLDALPDPMESVRLAERKARRTRILAATVGGGFILSLLVLWEVASGNGWVDPRFFSSPSGIFHTLVAGLQDGTLREEIPRQAWATLSGVLLSLGLGIVIGVLVGLMMASVPVIRWALSPLIFSTYALPKLALLPLMLIIFGLGNFGVIALGTLGVSYIMTLSTLDGVLYQDQVYRDVAKAFQIPTHIRVLYIILPGAISNISTGIKLSISQAFVVVVSAEIVMGGSGLGYIVWSSWQILNTDLLFIGILCIGILGFALSWIGNSVERGLTRWAPQNRK